MGCTRLSRRQAGAQNCLLCMQAVLAKIAGDAARWWALSGQQPYSSQVPHQMSSTHLLAVQRAVCQPAR